jgi:hypothetical protein
MEYRSTDGLLKLCRIGIGALSCIDVHT